MKKSQTHTTQNTNTNLIVVIATIAFVLCAAWLTKSNRATQENDSTAAVASASSNVSEKAGKQEVTITAGGGGYSPKVTRAKANMPTTLKLQGKNAYGCESAVRIPQLEYAKNLDANGSDTLEVPAQKPGTVLNGTCGMGMYSFQIKFN